MRAAAKRVPRGAWLSVVLAGLGFVGCRTVAPRPGGKVALSGAQIAAEMVESWLREARTYSFATRKLWPLDYSQRGIENLARGACDIACTDRLMTSRELEQFGDGAVRGYRVAFYGYALYVHPENPLDAIFAKHLEMVLQGRITDWGQLAGRQIPDWQGPIHTYGRAKGTRAGMQLSHMARIFFAKPSWKVCRSDAEVIAAVAADPYALGFATIGYDEGVRYLGLRMERAGRAVLPSLEEIEREEYGLAKVIYVYFVEPPSPAVQAVLEYLQSDEGRAAIEATDMWAVPASRAAVPPLR